MAQPTGPGVGEIEPHGEVIALVPPEFRPGSYGDRYPTADLRLGDLNMAPQVREGINPILGELQEDVRRNDMLHTPFVARLTEEEFFGYIDFACTVWNVSRDDVEYSQAADGSFLLVIAGHTRVTVAQLNEMQRSQAAAAAGYDTDPGDARVRCRVVEHPSIEEIIAIQMGENVHQQTRIERRAMLTVEAFEYGKRQGRWVDARGFAETLDGTLSPRAISDAMWFAKLPTGVRGQVYKGAIKYAVGVDLARTAHKHRRYICWRAFGGRQENTLDAEEVATLNQMDELWLEAEAARLQAKDINVPASKKRLQGYARNWEQAMNPEEEGEEAGLQTEQMLLVFADQSKEELRRLRGEYEAAIVELAKTRTDAAARLVAAHLGMAARLGVEVSAEVMALARQTTAAIEATAAAYDVDRRAASSSAG